MIKVSVIRRRIKRPEFKRQAWYTYKRLGVAWRAPKGNQSKLRMHLKGKGFLPSPGYGSPNTIKGIHPCGLQEVLVSNVAQLATVSPERQCVRIASTLGRRKRNEVIEKAAAAKIRILNPVKKYPEKKVKPEPAPETKEEEKS